MEPIHSSVLMCVYGGDQSEWLEDALRSLLSQSLPPDEIVLVKDGPVSDSLDRVIDRAAGEFAGDFRVHALDTNLGLVAALNAGLGLCRGELVFRMDADDVADRERIARQTAFMDTHPEIGVLGSAMQEFSDSADNPLRLKPVKSEHHDIQRQLVWRNPVNHPTVCLRRTAIPAEGYPSLQYLEDYFLWARLMASGVRFHNLAEPLLSYRFNDRTLARRSGWVNFRNEVYLRRWIYRHRLAGPVATAASIVLQAGLRFAPRGIQRRLWMSTRRRI